MKGQIDGGMNNMGRYNISFIRGKVTRQDIHLFEDQIDWLIKEAKQKQISKSSLLREIIDNYKNIISIKPKVFDDPIKIDSCEL